MIMTRTYLKRVLLLVLICSSILQGQELVRVDFRILSLGAPLEELALVGSNGMVDVEVPSFNRSDVITYKGDARLRFIRKSEYTPDEPLPKSLFEVDLSDNLKNPLIVVASAVKGHGFPYQAMVLPDNLKDLPGGSSYFINASPYPIAILFDQNKEPVKLKPRGAVKRTFEEGSHNIRVRIASYAEGEVRKGLDSRVYPLPIHRDIYFIYAHQGGGVGRLMIRRLREHQSSAEHNFRQAAEEE
jgi:hypothetical protein